MKKKTKIIILSVVGVVVIALIAGLVIPMVSRKKAGDSTSKEASAVSGKDRESRNAEGDEDDPSDGGGYSGGGTGGGYNHNTSGTSNDNKPQSGTNGQTSGTGTSSIPEIFFPYAIPGTDLVVEQVSQYNGYFIEDGSDREVSDIAAIVLKNNGSEDLEFAGIGISQGSRNLAFSASQIPAGATVIIQEQSGAAFTADPYYSATASTTATDSFEMSETLVSVKDNGDDSFTVINITDQTLSQVRVFFKNYLPDESVYVGGITYSVTLEDIEDGTAVDVYSDHYDSRYSKIVEVIAE